MVKFSLNTKMLCIIIIIVLCVLLMYKISCISKEKTIEQFKFKYKNPGCYIFTRNCKNNYWNSVTDGKWFNDEIHGATPIKSLEQCKTKRKEVYELCQGGYVKHEYIAGKDDTTETTETTETKVKRPGCYIFTRNCKNKYWNNRTNGKMDLVQFNQSIAHYGTWDDVYTDKICRQIKKNIQTLCKGSYVKSEFINSQKFIEMSNSINKKNMDKESLIKSIEILPILNEKLLDPDFSPKLAYSELINIKYIMKYGNQWGEIINVDSLENINYGSVLESLSISNIKIEYLKKMNIEKIKTLNHLSLTDINIGEDISDIKFEEMYTLKTLHLNNTNIGKYINNLHLPDLSQNAYWGEEGRWLGEHRLQRFKILTIENETIGEYIIGLRLPSSVTELNLNKTDITADNIYHARMSIYWSGRNIFINNNLIYIEETKLLNIIKDTRFDTNKGPNEKCFYYYKDGCNLFQGYKNNNWNKYDKNKTLFWGNWVSGCSSYTTKDSDSKHLSSEMCRNLLHNNLTNYVNPPVEIVQSVIKPDEPPKDRGCYVMFNKLCKRITESDANYLDWEEKSRKLNKWYKDLPPSCSDIKSKSKRAEEIENNCGLEPGDVQIISTM